MPSPTDCICAMGQLGWNTGEAVGLIKTASRLTCRPSSLCLSARSLPSPVQEQAPQRYSGHRACDESKAVFVTALWHDEAYVRPWYFGHANASSAQRAGDALILQQSMLRTGFRLDAAAILRA